MCDTCNNYFARKVEKPFLQHPAIYMLRHEQRLPNKRGFIPAARGVLLPNIPVTLQPYTGGRMSELEIPPEHVPTFLTRKHDTLILPHDMDPPEGAVVSRFLAKAALETFASRILDDPEWRESLVDEPQLDLLRNHARRGTDPKWPYHSRQVYDADHVDADGMQIVHEFLLLTTEYDEWYFILALFGTEYALNMGGPEIDGYIAWLEANEGKSPLYTAR